MGRRVLVLDGDLGMANVDLMFNIRPQLTLSDLFEGRAELSDIVTSVAPHVDLIPGGSGIYELSQLTSFQKQHLLDQVDRLDQNYDFLLIDTAPGIDDHVLYLNSAAQEIVLVVTSDPASITDAYALIKVLNLRHHESRFSVICNMVKDEEEAQNVYRKLSDVAMRFLCVGLDYRGFVPMDLNMRHSTRAQQLVSKVMPFAASGLAIRKLAESVDRATLHRDHKGGLQFFWQQMAGVA